MSRLGHEEFADAFTGKALLNVRPQPCDEKRLARKAADQWFATRRVEINTKMAAILEQLGLENNRANKRKYFSRVAWPMWTKAPAQERGACFARVRAKKYSARLEEGADPLDALPLEVLVDPAPAATIAAPQPRRLRPRLAAKVGDAVLASTKHFLRHGSSEEKRAAKNIAEAATVSMAACSGKPRAFCRRSLFGDIEWRGLGYAKKRSRAISDEVLVEALRRVSHESTTWSRKSKCPQWKFDGSKRQCFKEAKSLHLDLKGAVLKLKKSQLYERVKAGRLGFGVWLNRTDTCPICTHWDSKVAKPLSARAGDMMTDVASACVGFWTGMAEPRDQNCKFQRPSYVRALIAHIDAHLADCPECPAVALATLAKVELQEDVLPRCEEISFHLAMKDAIRHYVASRLDAKDLQETCFCFDYKALTTLPIGPVQVSQLWFARSRLGINAFICKV